MEKRREINCPRKNRRWRRRGTPQSAEPVARFALATDLCAGGTPSATPWTQIGDEGEQPRSMRVRLRSNCTGRRQQIIGTISHRARPHCGSRWVLLHLSGRQNRLSEITVKVHRGRITQKMGPGRCRRLGPRQYHRRHHKFSENAGDAGQPLPSLARRRCPLRCRPRN